MATGQKQRKPSPATMRRWQADFEAALPRMRRVIHFRLRHLAEEQRDEETSESLALAWRAYLSLRLRGKDPEPLIGKIAEYAARQVNSGRRLVGIQPAADIMSRTCQNRHGYCVESIPDSDREDADPDIIDALCDGTLDSPADLATLRVDYGNWLDSLDDHLRDAAEGFAKGLNNTEVGERAGFGRGTGSSWRRELRERWDQKFNDEWKR